MALKNLDITEHGNEKLAAMDSDFVRGGGRDTDNLTTLLTDFIGKEDQLKNFVSLVWVKDPGVFYQVKNKAQLGSLENGWKEFSTGGSSTAVLSTKLTGFARPTTNPPMLNADMTLIQALGVIEERLQRFDMDYDWETDTFTWKNSFGGLSIAKLFVPIAANEFGTHPEFETQWEFNQWILQNGGGIPNTTPEAPGIVADDSANTLKFTHALGVSEIIVSINSGAFIALTSVPGYNATTQEFSVGDGAIDAGYFKAKVKSAQGRNESSIASSPAFTSLAYTEVQTFLASVTASSFMVSSRVAAIDPDLKFEFNSRSNYEGYACTMSVYVGATNALIANFPSDYLNTNFRFTDVAGVQRSGVFTDGNINF